MPNVILKNVNEKVSNKLRDFRANLHSKIRNTLHIPVSHIALVETLKLKVNSPETAQSFEKIFHKSCLDLFYFVNLFFRSPFSISQETST
jgi:hypothetical protein